MIRACVLMSEHAGGGGGNVGEGDEGGCCPESEVEGAEVVVAIISAFAMDVIGLSEG
jgi:hypothetical protein